MVLLRVTLALLVVVLTVVASPLAPMVPVKPIWFHAVTHLWTSVPATRMIISHSWSGHRGKGVGGEGRGAIVRVGARGPGTVFDEMDVPVGTAADQVMLIRGMISQSYKANRRFSQVVPASPAQARAGRLRGCWCPADDGWKTTAS